MLKCGLGPIEIEVYVSSKSEKMSPTHMIFSDNFSQIISDASRYFRETIHTISCVSHKSSENHLVLC